MPAWLGVEDHPWLQALIDDFARLDGRPFREVRSFLEEPARVPAPVGKRRMAVWTLEKLCARERPPLDVPRLREAIAVVAQRARDRGCFDRAEVLAATAKGLGMSAAEAEEHLFADLPGERRLRLPERLPNPGALALETNVALAQGLLRLASDVTIDVCGGARALVRQVHLRRLLCTVRRPRADAVRLEISGAFALFRHTTIYGRALASILPLVAWCDRFDLSARCALRGRTVSVRLRPGDPIAAGTRPKPYDSRVEERFARDFARANLDWDLVREPEPVDAGDALVFPDFAVVHRRDASRRFLVEIVGFWTPDYLRAKIDRLRAMTTAAPLVLCIDRSLNCSREELPPDARVVWFRRRIDPGAVLAAVERELPRTEIRVERIGLADLFIGWAGRHPPADPIHGRLARLEVGEAVRLRPRGPWLAIETDEGPIGMLSAAARTGWLSRLDRVLSARVVDKVERRRAQSAPQWRHRLPCEQWVVPIVDVVLAATEGDGAGG